MRLVDIYIENFGRFHRHKITFEEGLHTIHAENGWGKSTLAAFIKVMFYGFEGERKQGIQNERKRYMPWQGGAYGGNLCFEVNGKRYRIHRMFGANSGKDVFELRDADTNLPVNDYSTQVGEELFGLDRESFQRTAYISEAGETLVKANGRIHAKLGDLAENTQDMVGYEKAMQKIAKRKAELGGRSINAKATVLKREIAELEGKAKQEKALLHQIEQQQEEQQNRNKRKVELKQKYQQKREEKEKILTKIAENRGAMEVAELTDLEKNRLSLLRKQFKNGLPQKSEIRKALTDCETIKALKVSMMHNQISDTDQIKLNQYEKLFKNGIPTNIEIEGIIYAWNQIETKKQDIKEQTQFMQEMDGHIRRQNKENRKDIGIFALCSLILFVVLLLTTKWILLGLFCLLTLGILILAFAIFRYQSKNVPMLREKAKYSAEIEIQKKSIQSLEREIVGFFRRYDQIHRLEYLPDVLWEWKQSRKEYVELIEKKQRAEADTEKQALDELLRGQKEFLNAYGIEVIAEAKSAEREILELLESSTEFLRLLEKERTAKEKKAEMMHWLSDSLNSTLSVDKDEWSQNHFLAPTEKKLLGYSAELEKLEEELAFGQRSILALEQQKEEVMESKIRLLAAKEELSAVLQEIQLLEQTEQFLEKAKTSFSEKYSNPILQSFRRFYTAITTQQGLQYKMDANIHLTTEEMGMQREVDVLSAGYQDLIGFCMRLALIEGMYQQEKPFLILDDPFINLDEEKMQRAIGFLKEIGQTYQILYFTCHESRT